MIEVVMEGGNDADAGISHALERVLRGQLALTQNLCLGRIDPALRQGLANGGRLWTARGPDVNRIGVAVFCPLHESREVLICDRVTSGADDLAARIPEPLMESGLAVVARAEVGDHGVDLADAVL